MSKKGLLNLLIVCTVLPIITLILVPLHTATSSLIPIYLIGVASSAIPITLYRDKEE
jgi:hypothetical protein